MSASILVTYATRYGSTQEVAEVVAATLREQGLTVDLQPMREVRTLDGYRTVVLGAPLYMGHWQRDAKRFLSRHKEALMQRLVMLFVLGPLRVDEGWDEVRGQLDKELAKVSWLKPASVELFGGRYEPANFRFPDNLLAALARHEGHTRQRHPRLDRDPPGPIAWSPGCRRLDHRPN